jgi:copper chaperone CopZ
MKTKSFATLSLIVVALTILSACSTAAQIEPAAPEVFVEEGRAEPADDFGFAGAGEAEKSAAPLAPDGVAYQTLPDVENAPRQAASVDRKIIKNAEVNVVVEDSDIAIDRLTQVVSDAGGYIVSSRVWYQAHLDGENYKYASITLGIPVDQFEVTMRRVRGLAIRVTDENASGEDVTDQFVDLQSRLSNLEATQARIQSFLEDAKSVDEALRINQELAQIEAQIEEVKGRMNYLSDRSAFSTITVTIAPELPEIEPVPAPEPRPWTPSRTLKDATGTLVKAYQGIVEFAIWVFVAVMPILAPPVLVVWMLFKLLRRKPAKQVSSSES